MNKALNNLVSSSTVSAAGTLAPHIGKYARQKVLGVFEMIGGEEAMAEWADRNKSDFYTKLFPKIIGKEVEHTASEGVESLLAKLDAAEQSGTPILEAAEYVEVVEDDDGTPSIKRMMLSDADLYADGEDGG